MVRPWTPIYCYYLGLHGQTRQGRHERSASLPCVATARYLRRVATRPSATQRRRTVEASRKRRRREIKNWRYTWCPAGLVRQRQRERCAIYRYRQIPRHCKSRFYAIEPDLNDTPKVTAGNCQQKIRTCNNVVCECA